MVTTDHLQETSAFIPSDLNNYYYYCFTFIYRSTRVSRRP